VKTKTINWDKNRRIVVLIDQTRLPGDVVYRECETPEDIADAILKLQVRGAPAIGIAGAMGLALAGVRWLEREEPCENLDEALSTARRILASARPTAVNLIWALDRLHKTSNVKENPEEKVQSLVDESLAILEEDERMCEALGSFGAELVNNGDRLLTHCNAGGLATSGYGTALAVFFTAMKQGKKIQIYADETRPLLQGARLTTWELLQAGIDVTLICDSTAAFLMQRKAIDAVFVGADRIAANGDAANKIGTYSLAVNARYHKIPFYVVAPYSTIDLSLEDGTGIPIEERSPEEVTRFTGVPVAPDGVKVFAPAFDITPASLITGIITEKGLISPPFHGPNGLKNIAVGAFGGSDSNT